MTEPCPVCQGLVVAARDGARRCTSCGRAWDAEGTELPEDEAQKLVPKPRGGRAGGRTRPGSSRRGARSGSKRTA